MTGHWEHFEHVADIGIRGFGSTPAEAFAQAGLALTALITDLGKVAPQQRVHVELEEEDDLEYLFFDWINAIVYHMSTHHLLFSRYEVRIAGNRLQAELRGEPVDPQRHAPAVEVKGATFTALAVRQEGDQWIAQCVVDV
ncbi:MAG: archease [Gammaproteobacteria bacterium]|nr:MAG: archease [Gammaproteobacteria bacterium]